MDRVPGRIQAAELVSEGVPAHDPAGPRELPGLDGVEVQVAVAPVESVLVHTLAALTDDAVRGPSPRRWRRALRARLRPRDVEALGPLVAGRTQAWPSCLTSTALDTQALAVEAGAGVADGRLCAQAWDPVLRAPGRWLPRYVAAVRRAWGEFEPRWRRSAALLEREVERVRAAAAHGAVRELAGALHPYDTERGLRVHDGRLIVKPLLAHSVCLVETDRGGRLHAFSYPLPNAWQAFDDCAPAPASLEGLLGSSRAAILRLLDAPTPAGNLAESLALGRSGVSHHLDALEPAGLIARERRGRHVLVRRTTRGTRLLELYEAP
jgi:DNA-binding transcriptional ArsR family regulator